MDQRKTLKRAVDIEGVGLHTGRTVRLVLRPAAAGQGVSFRRSDLGVEIPARVSALARLEYATTLSQGGATVDTVEHLLAALYALGVDDAVVELDGPEVPILDGSAAPFVKLLLAAGLRGQGLPRTYLKVLEPVAVTRGEKWLRLSPGEGLSVSYTIGFEHKRLRHQAASYRLSPDTFVSEIAPARTFGFLHEVESLRRSGLARGGSLENAVVFGEDGPLTPLRFEDECVRHKILDALGDLALVGFPVLGQLEAHKAGHALHAALARKLMATPQAWGLVEAPWPQRETAVGRLAARPAL